MRYKDSDWTSATLNAPLYVDVSFVLFECCTQHLQILTYRDFLDTTDYHSDEIAENFNTSCSCAQNCNSNTRSGTLKLALKPFTATEKPECDSIK